MEVVEEKIQRTAGKVAAQDRWSRDEIRDAVDAYLQTLDLESGGGGADENLLAMLMQMGMFTGGPSAASTGPDGTGGDGSPSDVEIARKLAGRGGLNDGT